MSEQIYPQPNERWQDDIGIVRIMAVVENYVMARRHGCNPFIEHRKEFVKQFKRVKPEQGER